MWHLLVYDRNPDDLLPTWVAGNRWREFVDKGWRVIGHYEVQTEADFYRIPRELGLNPTEKK